jgi:hypothetical protein
MGIFGFDGINIIQSVSHRDWPKISQQMDWPMGRIKPGDWRGLTGTQQITTHSITYRDKHVFDIHFWCETGWKFILFILPQQGMIARSNWIYQITTWTDLRPNIHCGVFYKHMSCIYLLISALNIQQNPLIYIFHHSIKDPVEGQSGGFPWLVKTKGSKFTSWFLACRHPRKRRRRQPKWQRKKLRRRCARDTLIAWSSAAKNLGLVQEKDVNNKLFGMHFW